MHCKMLEMTKPPNNNNKVCRRIAVIRVEINEIK